MKKSSFLRFDRPLRRAGLVFGCVIALCAGFTVWSHRAAQADAPGRKTSTSGRAQDNGQMTYGTAQTVGKGTTVSVADLMATEKKRPRSKDETERFTKNEYEFFMERRSTLRQNPASPLSATWPPTDPEPVTDTQSATPPIRNTPQTVGRNFLGASRIESGGFTPPDSHGAVGPTQVVVAANVFMRSFNKATGDPDGVLNLSLSAFFSSVSGGAGLSDPRVKFDPISRRWFVSIITTSTTNQILLAVSSGPNITSTSSFTFFSFAATDGGGSETQTPFADYDTLGIDARGVYLCVNMFNTAGNALLGSTVFVLNKANLLAPSPTVTVTAFRRLNNGSGAGPSTPYVADNPDPEATEAYLIGPDNVSLGLLVLRRITGADTATPAISDNLNLTVPATAAPINVPVQGRTQAPLDALDDRLYEAKIRNGRLWTCHNIQVDATGVASATGGRTGSRWYEIGTLSTTPTLIQSGTLFSNAAVNPDSFWIPSIGITGQGHAALACSAAGAARFTDIVYAGRLSGDPLGTLRAPTTAVTATNSYTLTASRWGDYSHVATDPNDDMTMWTFQEYAPGVTDWGVRAVQLVAPPPATLTSISPTSATQGQTLNITVNGTSTNGSGFYNPPAPFPNKLAADFGTGVTINSVTFNSPTQAVFNVTVQGGAATGVRNVTVTNPDGQTTTGNNLFTVNAGCATPISVSPTTLPGGVRNVPYSAQTASATGGAAPYTFSLATGALPSGLTLSSGGLLSGTPTVAGSFTFTVLATDNAGCTGATTYAITIGSPVLAQGAVTITTGNNLIEPNECNSLNIALSNSGTADAAGVTAILSSTTPGVTIATAAASYPTLAAGGAVQPNTTAFQVSTGNSIACLSTINFTLNVTYTGGSATFNFTQTVGQPPGTNYIFTSTTGATIPGTPGAGTLVPGTQDDDAVASLPLPAFAFSVYGTPVSSMTVDTNGNIRINGAGATSVTNGNLPSGTFPVGTPVLLAYWDDLDMSPTVTIGGGVYTQTVGTAPNRQFVVEWRARHWINNQPLGGVDTNFAIVFNEGSNRFNYVYALTGAGAFVNGVSATVGVQADTTGSTFTQFSSNTASLFAGQKLDTSFAPGVCSPGSGGCAVTCSYQVTPINPTIIGSPGSATVTVTTGNGCQWTAQSNTAWLTIQSGATGNGNGTVQVRIALNNTAAPRTGTLTVAGQTVTFNQSRPNASTPGQYRPSNGFVYVRNTNETGFADTEFFYGTASDQPISGDWDGNGTDTIGIYRNGTFFLRNSNTSGFADIQFPFGAPGDIPLAGDWDGDGVDTIGVVRGNVVFLKNSNTSGNADFQFAYGTATDRFITGDWNGDGVDTIGCFRPSDGYVYLRDTNTTGVADFLFFYGQASDKPVVGDWNGDGVDTIGVVRGNQWFLRNSNSSGFADIQYFYGTDTDVPISGDWDGQP
jgi:hypothetical protein